MSKYSSEFKLEVVQYYLKRYGYVKTAKHFNLDIVNRKIYIYKSYFGKEK